MKNTTIKLPKIIPLFSSTKIVTLPISVPVEFKEVDKKKCFFKDVNNNECYFSYETKNFGKNFFQIFKKTIHYYDNADKFFIDIGRAISYGYKESIKTNDSFTTSIGGLLSPMFNATIEDNGKIFVKGKEYKLIILYAPTFILDDNNEAIKIDRPSIVTIKNIDMFVGKFTFDLINN